MRCVICHPATAELPGELLTSLSRRMGRMTICTDIYAALAECCLIQHEQAQAGKGDAGGAKPGAVLVIVHPRHMPDAGGVRLVEAARNYAPGVALWRYDRSANPKLRAVVEEDVATGFATTETPMARTMPAGPADAPQVWPHVGPQVWPPVGPVVQTRPVHDVTPKYVNGTGHASPTPTTPLTSPTPTAPSQQRGVRGSSLLTEDELRMLLSADPMEGVPLGSGSHRPTPRTPNMGGGA